MKLKVAAMGMRLVVLAENCKFVLDQTIQRGVYARTESVNALCMFLKSTVTNLPKCLGYCPTNTDRIRGKPEDMIRDFRRHSWQRWPCYRLDGISMTGMMDNYW